MRRSIESVIESWATKDASRPLLIRGARRVGKTYAAEEIGRRIAGDAFVKLDFQTDLELIAPLFPGHYVGPDWTLGVLFGLGGLAGMYAGARCQKHLPERPVRLLLAVIVLGTALGWLLPLL